MTYPLHALVAGVFAYFVANLSMAEDDHPPRVIGRMDNVEVRVLHERNLTTRGQLSESGALSMPLIGVVQLEGLTTDQAAAAITRKLADGYLVNPEVSVSIESKVPQIAKVPQITKERKTAMVSKTVIVVGQVRQPGAFELPAKLTLVGAIGMAGGVTRISNSKKIRLERVLAGGGHSLEIINLSDITKGKHPDIPLRDGDVITIPESLF